MTYWKPTPPIKIYEAVSAVADGRVEIVTASEALVSSSDHTKKYTVNWDQESNAIMTNDNGTYWQGYLGYPAIAFLMTINKLEYEPKVATFLAGIVWKELNTRYNNNYDQAIKEVLDQRSDQAKAIEEMIDSLDKQLHDLSLHKLGKRMQPPKL